MSGGEHVFVSGDDVSAHAGVIPVSRDVFSAPAGVIPASGDEHVSVHVEQDLYTSCVLAKLDQVLPQFARLDQKLPQLVEMDCHGSVHGSGRAGTVEVGHLGVVEAVRQRVVEATRNRVVEAVSHEAAEAVHHGGPGVLQPHYGGQGDRRYGTLSLRSRSRRSPLRRSWSNTQWL